MVGGVGLLTLAFAPFGQFYLAWVALVPLLLVVGRAASVRAAFAWGGLAGFLFFTVNIWWLWKASVPGTGALVLYFALYWAAAAALLRWGRLIETRPLSGFIRYLPNRLASSRGRLDGKEGRPGVLPGISSIVAVLLVATVWVAFEWLRGNAIRGFPWLFLGTSQTPIVSMCQVADWGGPYAVSFWVVLVNAVLTVLLLAGWRAALPACGAAAVVLAATLGYGMMRLSEAERVPGPQVMVVQSNHPHLRGGAATVSREAAVEDFLEITAAGLNAASPDLIVWSEAAMPPLNPEAREHLAQAPTGPFLVETHQRLGELAGASGASLVTGGYYVGGWQYDGRTHLATDIRNSAFLYGPDGRQSEVRYDKIQLAPFSETLPEWVYRGRLGRLMLWLAAPSATQPLTPGTLEEAAVFTLDSLRSTKVAQPQGAGSSVAGSTPPTAGFPESAETSRDRRFAAPICLEHVDPRTVRALVRTSDGGKRVDFLVDLSNDGWFAPQAHWQHLQVVVFRTIEHRLPMARSVNTGPSGFIDSSGRIVDTLPVFTSGTLSSTLQIDPRTTFYTRNGDVFAVACVVLTGLLGAGVACLRPFRVRSGKSEQAG